MNMNLFKMDKNFIKTAISFSIIYLVIIFLGLKVFGNDVEINSTKNNDNNIVNVQLLGINDFHGQIDITKTISGKTYGRADFLSANLKLRKQENKNTFIVHAGDVVGASAPVSALLKDEPTIKILNKIGFDVGTVGNHEFDKGSKEMLRLTNRVAEFPYTATNIVDKKTKKPILQPYIIKRVQGVKVGFLGVITQETPSIVMPDGIKNIEFIDAAESVNKYVNILKRNGVSTIILLAHIPGYQNSKTNEITGEVADLANKIDDEVDVIFAGHNHGFLNGNVDGKLIVESYSSGTAFSDVDLEISKKTKNVINKKAEIVNNTQENIIADSTITKLTNKYENIVAPVINEVVGRTETKISGVQNSSGESALGNLIADSQNKNMGTDFAFMNPGGIRADIEAGEITWGDLFLVQPFNNNLVKVSMSGIQVKNLLNQQWQGTQTKILQISGLKYTWDSTKENGNKIVNIWTAKGDVLSDNKIYTVTVNSFLSSGGDGFTIMNTINNKEVGSLDIDAFVEYVKTFKVSVTAKVDGRILKIK